MMVATRTRSRRRRATHRCCTSLRLPWLWFAVTRALWAPPSSPRALRASHTSAPARATATTPHTTLCVRHSSTSSSSSGEESDASDSATKKKEITISRCGVSSDGRFASDSWLRGVVWAAELKNEGEPIYDVRSAYQRVTVVDTVSLGRALILDGALQCAEKDEAGYHEMLSHVPMLRRKAPRRSLKALIVGGGDGGCARELLKHAHIQSIDLVEIDEHVVRAVQTHMPAVWPEKNVANDERLSVKFADAAEFVLAAPPRSYDIILVDASDPIGPGATLYTVDFYAALRRLLRPRGALAVQAGSFFYLPSVFRAVYHRLYAAGFAVVKPYSCFTAVYPGGLWNLACATLDRRDDPAKCDKRRARAFCRELLLDRNQNRDRDRPLQFYDADAHRAAFAVPPLARAELAKPPPLDPAADLRDIYGSFESL